MLIRKPADFRYSDVTPKEVYLNRRRFLGAAAGAAIAGSVTAEAGGMKLSNVTKTPLSLTLEKNTEKPSPYEATTTYNNFYEFGTGKDEPAQNAKEYRTKPWTLTIDGEVAKKKTLDFDALYKIAPLEERIYRHRCVEAWSIVVPWIGFPLAAIIKLANPLSNAKYVAFQSF